MERCTAEDAGSIGGCSRLLCDPCGESNFNEVEEKKKVEVKVEVEEKRNKRG